MKKVFLVLILLVIAIFSFSAEIDTTFLSYSCGLGRYKENVCLR
jgi:Na+-transporting methylmalonyl-CoA/oxaloacetate decarboxylase gamma subunit